MASLYAGRGTPAAEKRRTRVRQQREAVSAARRARKAGTLNIKGKRSANRFTAKSSEPETAKSIQQAGRDTSTTSISVRKVTPVQRTPVGTLTRTSGTVAPTTDFGLFPSAHAAPLNDPNFQRADGGVEFVPPPTLTKSVVLQPGLETPSRQAFREQAEEKLIVRAATKAEEKLPFLRGREDAVTAIDISETNPTNSLREGILTKEVDNLVRKQLLKEQVQRTDTTTFKGKVKATSLGAASVGSDLLSPTGVASIGGFAAGAAVIPAVAGAIGGAKAATTAAVVTGRAIQGVGAVTAITGGIEAKRGFETKDYYSAGRGVAGVGLGTAVVVGGQQIIKRTTGQGLGIETKTLSGKPTFKVVTGKTPLRTKTTVTSVPKGSKVTTTTIVNKKGQLLKVETVPTVTKTKFYQRTPRVKNVLQTSNDVVQQTTRFDFVQGDKVVVGAGRGRIQTTQFTGKIQPASKAAQIKIEQPALFTDSAVRHTTQVGKLRGEIKGFERVQFQSGTTRAVQTTGKVSIPPHTQIVDVSKGTIIKTGFKPAPKTTPRKITFKGLNKKGSLGGTKQKLVEIQPAKQIQTTKPITLKAAPKFKRIPISVAQPKPVASAVLLGATTGAAATKLGTFSLSATKSETRLGLGTVPIQTTSTTPITTTSRVPIQTTSTSTRLGLGTPVTPFGGASTVPFIPPIIGGLPFDFGGSTRTKQPGGVKRQFKYDFSLVAKVGNIKATKKPGVLTGLGVRPLL